MVSDALLIAACTGPGAIALDRSITWLRTRRLDDAKAGLTVDQRWQNLNDALDHRIGKLEDRVDELEADVQRERDRANGLAAEVDRYRRIAKSLVRHVIKLRDALAAARAEAPELPADIEEAIVTLDLP